MSNLTQYKLFIADDKKYAFWSDLLLAGYISLLHIAFPILENDYVTGGLELPDP